ncbi:MAG: STAS domain-containing protein [Planctomycetes bacterium]|nr:STAS domain-containing protein [Planctomycetota bacterium]
MEFVLDVGKKYPEITGPISDAFANELRNVVRAGEFQHLVLDFGGTRMISSMAMGSIFKEYSELKNDNKSLRIVNASPKVQHLFQMVNMADLLA